MSTTTVLLFISVGIMLGAKADLTLRELEQKINNLDKLERNFKWLVKEFSNLKDQLENRSNIAENLELRHDTVENLDKEVNNLTNLVDLLNQNVINSETEIVRIQNQLEHGGKNFQTLPYNSK